jgi:radical SAM family uncharacterized protein
MIAADQPTLRQRVSEELLPAVRQPGQYIGGEINQLVRPGDWEAAEVRVALAFPDTYAIGMSHLGGHILYWLCNHTPGVVAERVYCPWLDAEQVMRERRIPLFTWDTRQPVGQADILGISLQYEMTYTNVLTLLDLAGIPLLACERDESHPLVVAGGPQADNPEPIAEALDLVVLGDGEESLAALLEAYRQMKRAGMSRREMIAEMARRFPWCYAPSLYEVRYLPDGRVAAVEPTIGGIPEQVARCGTSDFERAAFPVRPIVPFTEAVHDRISIEIMRGCPQRCRFCHAGYNKRPLKLRSVDRILEIAEQAYRATGQDEIGLLSLSTSDYPKLKELAERINERFAERRVNISMPSLRVDNMLSVIPWMANEVRKGGLTIAAEAARDDMRCAIRKKVSDGDLMDGVREAYRAGWRRVKLYFMCGFPGEQEEDIRGIVALARQVSEARRDVAGGPARVTASVSWLVPKPNTPLQWAAQPTADYFRAARSLLLAEQRGRGGAVRVKCHHVERAVLEAALARGDRRLWPVIVDAWRRGARFDGWDEAFDAGRWQAAFASAGVDPVWYAHRQRDYSETLPWEHLAPGQPRAILEKENNDLLARVGQRS